MALAPFGYMTPAAAFARDPDISRLLDLVAEGHTLSHAAALSGLGADRVLELLHDLRFREVLYAATPADLTVERRAA